MVKRQVFNGFSPNESKLFNGLVDEAIELYGIPVYYLPKKFLRIDKFHGEDPLNYFNETYEMTMDMAGLEEYTGGVTVTNGNGYNMFLEQGFTIARGRFRQYTNETMDKPLIGDILYVPFIGKFFKINGFDDINSKDFYTHGVNHVFHISVEMWDWSHEGISTGDPEVDNNIPTEQAQKETENDVVDDYNEKEEIQEAFSDDEWIDE